MENHFTRQTAGGVIFLSSRAYIFLTEYTPEWRNMKRRPHKIDIGGIAGGIDCRHGHGMPYTEVWKSRNKRWAENTETAGRF